MRKEHAIVSLDRGIVSIEAIVAQVAQVIALWRHRHESRINLQQLDDRLLRDIGLQPADVEWETGKPFWEA